ncbi:MAG: adenosylcobinamide-phosphate synthase CbiB [Treponema sp.]|jgi:adenosylcobinamide-phosphate synthase|nr:adenosylcobinamide-phosphate synthase CbiB [Treponema sp.]
MIFLYSTLAMGLGFILDLILGDPEGFPHIVRFFGFLIARGERLLWNEKGNNRLKGLVFTLMVLCICSGIPLLLMFLAYSYHAALGLLVETFFCYQCISVKDLRVESERVYKALKAGDLEGARFAVSRIVGRDTERLDEAGITRATVETVAENTSDGVGAPLFYMALGGAAAACLYKAANTMDSMVGYKNDRYIHFGCAAARLDDGLNLLPSRLSALAMIAAAFMFRYDGKGAFRIWRRDRRKHPSPNAAQTEAACAGALGLRLSGSAYYHGVREDKPEIGDAIHPIASEDIKRSITLLYGVAFIIVMLSLGIRLCLYMVAIYTGL